MTCDSCNLWDLCSHHWWFLLGAPFWRVQTAQRKPDFMRESDGWWCVVRMWTTDAYKNHQEGKGDLWVMLGTESVKASVGSCHRQTEMNPQNAAAARHPRPPNSWSSCSFVPGSAHPNRLKFAKRAQEKDVLKWEVKFALNTQAVEFVVWYQGFR